MSSDSSIESNESHNLPPRKRRDNLPQAAREYLRRWLQNHIDHPYPTEEQKATFAHVLNLTPLQINNWFINARRRDLPKMKIEMGLLLPDTLHTSRKAIKRRYMATIDTDSENERSQRPSHINVHTCGTQPGISVLKRINPHSSLGRSSNEMNITIFEYEYNLKLLSLAALIHDSHC